MADPIAGTIRASSEAAMPASQSRSRRYLGVLLCIGVSGLFLYLAVRKADFFEVRQALGAMHLRWLLPIIIISLVDFWLRAVRWTWMFPPESRPTVRQTFSSFMIGALTNNFVPGRLGDVARSGMIGRRLPTLGTTGAFATVVLEKVVDGLMLLALLGLAFLVAPLPLWLAKSGALGSVIFLGSLFLLFIINAHGKAKRASCDSSTGASRFGNMFSTMQRLLNRFALGLTALNSQRQAVAVLMSTLAIWFLEFTIMFIVFRMFGLDLPFTAAIVTGVMVSVGMIVPAAPGAIGTYQFFTVTGLQLYQVPESQALALGVFLNLFVFIYSTALGLLALSLEGMNWLSYWRAPTATHQLISNGNR